MYEEWCKTFDPEQHKGEISELLVNVPEIRALYAKLVGTCTLFFYIHCCVLVVFFWKICPVSYALVFALRDVALKTKTDSLCHIHGQVTLLSQYFSPPWSIN